MGMEIARELYVLGMSVLHLGKAREAAFQFRKALGIAPDFSDASLALGHCLHELGEYEEALSVYDRLLKADPLLVAAWNNQGTTLLEVCRYAEAAASYARALELAPDLHDAGVAMATCYQALGRVEEALAACDAVLAADPGHAEAHWNKGLLLLLSGDYRTGWQEYEWRWQKRNFTSPLRHFPQPRWQGEPAAGKTILVHAEQGFGDTLQFCRYIPLVAARGARVVFECHPPLAALMKGLTGVAEVIPMGRPLPEFDLHVPLLSLPLIFDTTLETIPAAIPYLKPPTNRLPLWRSITADDNRFKVGLCWARKPFPDPDRCCPPDVLSVLQGIAGISFYSLQVGYSEGAKPDLQLIDLTAQLHDFADTAALVSCLDLVISVDTAVAHLAGALGKECWILLTTAPDWRWLLERQDSPWYPTMRLIRQDRPEAWEDVVQRVAWSLAREAV